MKQTHDIRQLLAQSSGTSPLARILLQLRYEIKNKLAPYPEVYLPLARLSPVVRRAKRAVIINPDTQFTLEAFQGSGNTYALGLFRSLDLSIAHHSHAASQVIASVRRGLPTLLIVREPEEATLSFIARVKVLSLGQALREYTNFHRHIYPYREGVVVATFDELLADPTAAVKRLDERFATGFARSLVAVPNRAEAEVKTWHSVNREGLPTYEADVPLPSAVRDERKELLKEHLYAPHLSPLLKRAEAIYEKFVALA